MIMEKLDVINWLADMLCGSLLSQRVAASRVTD